MPIDKSFWGEYVPALYSAKSETERFQVYEKYILTLGFSGATYTFTPRIQIEAMTNLPLIFLHTQNYPLEFLQEYRENRFDLEGYDFAINKSMQQGETGPMDWRQHEIAGGLNEKELYLIRLAREKYNIQNAISIPTLLDEKGAAGVSVISDAADKKFAEITNNGLEELVAATRLFHDTNFTDLRQFILPVFQGLKPREIAILYYKISGHPMKTVADATGLSDKVAARTLHDLKHRLGRVNNDRLLYLFVLLTSINGIPPEHLPKDL